MFINLFKFCDVITNNYKQLIDFDIFKVIPFTIILTFRKDLYDKNFKSFSEIFNLIESLKSNQIISKKSKLSQTTKTVIIDKKYTDYFDLNGKQHI